MKSILAKEVIMQGGAVFISHPTAVLQQYLKAHDKRMIFKYGQLAVALEVMTQIKILESMPMTDLSTQLISSFQALLIDLGLLDEAETWYERLDAWRQPRFVRDPAAIPGIVRAVGVSSIPGAHEGSLARTRRLHEELRERRDLGEQATSLSVESSDEEAGSTSSEQSKSQRPEETS